MEGLMATALKTQLQTLLTLAALLGASSGEAQTAGNSATNWN
jgi:hypothetical protein